MDTIDMYGIRESDNKKVNAAIEWFQTIYEPAIESSPVEHGELLFVDLDGLYDIQDYIYSNYDENLSDDELMETATLINSFQEQWLPINDIEEEYDIEEYEDFLI